MGTSCFPLLFIGNRSEWYCIKCFPVLVEAPFKSRWFTLWPQLGAVPQILRIHSKLSSNACSSSLPSIPLTFGTLWYKGHLPSARPSGGSQQPAGQRPFFFGSILATPDTPEAISAKKKKRKEKAKSNAILRRTATIFIRYQTIRILVPPLFNDQSCLTTPSSWNATFGSDYWPDRKPFVFSSSETFSGGQTATFGCL